MWMRMVATSLIVTLWVVVVVVVLCRGEAGWVETNGAKLVCRVNSVISPKMTNLRRPCAALTPIAPPPPPPPPVIDHSRPS